MNLFDFMSASPVLTFFIVLIIGLTIESVAKNTRRRRCSCKKDEVVDDESS